MNTLLFHQKVGEAQAFSNRPVKINNSKAKCTKLKVSEKEINKVNDVSFEVSLDANKKLKFKKRPLSEGQKMKAEKIKAKADLKAKLEAGTHTEEDITKALNLLL